MAFGSYSVIASILLEFIVLSVAKETFSPYHRYVSNNQQFQNVQQIHSAESSSSEERDVLLGFLSEKRDFLFRNVKINRSCAKESERLDPLSLTCYKIGTSGPCGPLMIFLGNENIQPEDSSGHGHCQCDHQRYDRPLISVNGQCHFLYSQAFCDVGEILVMTPSKFHRLIPTCRPNPCRVFKRRLLTTEVVPFEGQCAKLNAPSILCPGKDDVISFSRDHFQPICKERIRKTRRLFRRQITRTNELKCQKGYGKAKGSSRCYRLLKISMGDDS